MKVWVVRGGERWDDYTATIGVCATKELAEELMDREHVWPDRWATVHEEELITELPEWTPPQEVTVWVASFDPSRREIRVSSEVDFEVPEYVPAIETDNGHGEASGTDRDAVIGFVRKWCEDRHFRNVKVVEE